MLISDIKRTCQNCNGNGFQAGFKQCGSIQTNLKKSCLYCLGKGYKLTKLGENLWEFFIPMIQDLIRDEVQKIMNVTNGQNTERNSKKLDSSR